MPNKERREKNLYRGKHGNAWQTLWNVSFRKRLATQYENNDALKLHSSICQMKQKTLFVSRKILDDKNASYRIDGCHVLRCWFRFSG